MRQEKSNKIVEYYRNLSSTIDRYIYETKVIIDIRGLIILFAFFIFLAVSAYFGRKITDNCVMKIALWYPLIAFGYSSIILLISIIYRKINDATKTDFDHSFKKMIWIFLVIFVPIFGVIKIIDLIVNHRAKKTDNIEIMLLIIVTDMIILINYCGVDFTWITKLYNLVNSITLNRFYVKIEEFPFELLIILTSFKIVIDLANKLILYASKKYGYYSIKKSVKDQRRLKAEKFKPEDDINNYINEIKEYEKDQNEELKYDLKYLEKSFFRFQLLVLVILFVIETIAPDYLFPGYQSDAINVITIFTLVILLIDKNKEWNKELKKLLDASSNKTNDKEEKPKIILDK